jgi:hypothetical protein
MGEPALDYHGCHQGFYLGIETKKEGGEPTPRQLRTMRKIKAAGGSIFLIAGRDCADMQQLVGWLISPHAGFISQGAQIALGAGTTKEQADESRNDRPGDSESRS